MKKKPVTQAKPKLRVEHNHIYHDGESVFEVNDGVIVGKVIMGARKWQETQRTIADLKYDVAGYQHRESLRGLAIFEPAIKAGAEEATKRRHSAAIESNTIGPATITNNMFDSREQVGRAIQQEGWSAFWQKMKAEDLAEKKTRAKKPAAKKKARKR